MRLKQENVLLKRALNTRHEFCNIIGRSDAMLAVFKMIETIAKTNSTVLITGESGTGKDLVARAVHYNSLRREHPFVALNCGALPETLLESELFGHMRGAFTGADTNKKGLVEVAERGTIFLDEIGEMTSDDAGEAAARAAGPPVPPARRDGGSAGRHPGDRGDEPGPAEDGGRGAVPRRPVLPHQRDPGAPAAAARAARGRAAPGRSLPDEVREGGGQNR